MSKVKDEDWALVSRQNVPATHYSNLEETLPPDRPTDFSVKYDSADEDQSHKDDDIEEPVSYVTSTNYAETDLDQPTDYSLRYTESEDVEFNKTTLDKNKTNFDVNDDVVMTYCTEGTPYQTPCVISSATSMSDLHQLSGLEEEKDTSVDTSGNNIVTSPQQDEKVVVKDVTIDVAKTNNLKEGKVVTFSTENQFAEETPLMFSRSSSLGSLSSFDQHSFHDDDNSVISEFSRRASEVVSPSDLPDSPTDTTPPSPPTTETPYNKVNDVTQEITKVSDVSDVFYEEPKVHNKEEELSKATSLSSLTFDDDFSIDLPVVLPVTTNKTEPPSKEPLSVVIDISKEVLAEPTEDEEDVLAACITMGMPNKNRLKQHITPLKSRSKLVKPDCNKTNSMSERSFYQLRSNSRSGSSSSSSLKDTNCNTDSVRTYYTEGTPYNISHSGSTSDLSVLVIDKDDDSDDQDSILAQCIQSGKPKNKSS